MNNQKEIIMSKILNDNLDNIYEDIENYLKEYPYDIDIIMVKGYTLNKLLENSKDLIWSPTLSIHVGDSTSSFYQLSDYL